jgi:hypothetical protein
MRYSNPDIESSYRENDLGQTLYDLVLDLRPKKIIEFGVLGGYSTVAMAMALDKLGRGTIHAYDLWEKYPHKHSTMKETAENIRAYGLEKYVQLHYGDYKTLPVEDFDLMHLDVSNTGEILRDMVLKWSPFGGRIVFEGGTPERDAVQWMRKFKKTPLRESGINYETLNPSFPGLSIV